MRSYEAVVEVSHVGTENRPLAGLRRTSRERQAGGVCGAQTRPQPAAREEEGPVRDVPVIAIVDDDPSFREALERFLKTFTVRVRSFASGEEFLESSELRRVSCLLLDLAMPGMNGIEVKQELGARGLRIPTIFVTAHADEEMEPHLMAAGAIAILPKPVDQQMLLRLVQRVVGEQ
jgi:FixJ family two-component response regulator